MKIDQEDLDIGKHAAVIDLRSKGTPPIFVDASLKPTQIIFANESPENDPSKEAIILLALDSQGETHVFGMTPEAMASLAASILDLVARMHAEEGK